MENKTLLQKIRSVKYCLMAHPHNEQDSEFADRIDDLQEIEDSLEAKAEQPVRKTLDAGEYLKSKGLKNPPLDSGISGGGDAPRKYASNVMQDYAELYASQAKAVEPQEGWVSIKDRMPEENQLVDIWKHDSYRDDWFRQINVIYKDEHICEFSHWMPLPEPPTQTNN